MANYVQSIESLRQEAYYRREREEWLRRQEEMIKYSNMIGQASLVGQSYACQKLMEVTFNEQLLLLEDDVC